MTDEEYRQAARKQYGREGEIEIDDDGIVSRGEDPGAYVQAWVWVANEEEESTPQQPAESGPQAAEPMFPKEAAE